MIPPHFFGWVFMAALSCATPRTDITEPATRNSRDEQVETADGQGKLSDREGDDGPCLTTGGVKCVFPFTYFGQTYKSCAKSRATGYWCSTEVDLEGRFISGKWDYCNVATRSCTEDLATCISRGKSTGAANAAFDCLPNYCGARGRNDDGIAPWHAVITNGQDDAKFVGVLISPWHVLMVCTVHLSERRGPSSYLVRDLRVFLNNEIIEENKGRAVKSRLVVDPEIPQDWIITLNKKVDLPYACLEFKIQTVGKAVTFAYLEGNGVKERQLQITFVVGYGDDSEIEVNGATGIHRGTAWIADGGFEKLVGVQRHDWEFHDLTYHRDGIKKVLKQAYP